MRDKKGQLNGILASFIIIAAALIMLILLLYTFGSLNTSFEGTNTATTVTNESDNNGNIVFLNQTGYTVVAAGYGGTPRNFTVTQVLGSYGQSNGTDSGIVGTPLGYNVTIAAGNYSINSTTGVLTNASTYVFPNVSVSYTFRNNTASQAATGTAITSTANAVPLVGIIFVVVAIGAIIGILIGAFAFRKNRA